MALIPQIVDAAGHPCYRCGGIMDGRGIGCRLTLGAQGVQMGTSSWLQTNVQLLMLIKKLSLQQMTATAVTGRITELLFVVFAMK